jgi:Fe-S-cluster containining protein
VVRVVLKLKRMSEWLEVLSQERATRNLAEVVKALWKMLRGAMGAKVPIRVWRHRIRVCLRCPLYDRTMKRCRPYAVSPLGCGCYVPYLAMVPKPYEHGCWVRQAYPDTIYGWGVEEAA